MPITHYPLSITHCPLSITHCPLPIAHMPVLAMHIEVGPVAVLTLTALFKWATETASYKLYILTLNSTQGCKFGMLSWTTTKFKEKPNLTSNFKATV